MKVEEDIDEAVVALDTYNSDLNLVIDAAKYSAHPLTNGGFAFMWAGVRATHGAAKGKFCFEVKVLKNIDVSHLPSDEPNPHVVRVGASVEKSSLQLGEEPLSYGYGGTGKISTNCQFKDFGGEFKAGDVILCAVSFESDQVQIGYGKNGNWLGWAFKVKTAELKGQALFPHILTKNCSFHVNFGQEAKPYFELPNQVKDFTFIECLSMEQRVGGTRPPKLRQDCEMIMMCGLPGAGKSVWAAEYAVKNPAKKYNVLGTNNIIDKMKVMGLPRKRNYAGRWDVLIQMATKCLNKMFEIGSKLRRNYILDQTNVYPTAQRRKMRNFEGFKRTAVVVVPTEEEFRRRCDKRDREEGKEVPDDAVLEMKANFKLPEVGDVFDDVIFTELQREEAEKLVKNYNEEGRNAMGPSKKMFKPNDFGSNKGFDSGGENFMSNRGNSRDGFDGGRRGRGGFGGNHGFEGAKEEFGGRGGYMGGRGGFNGGRGGFDGGRGGFDGGSGGFDGGRGGFNSGRGGYGGGRGGYDDGRGNYNGGFGGRGGFDGRRGRGGFDGGRGGRGGFDGGQGERGGFDGGQGGRGGFDGGQGGRGSFDGGQRGRGGFDGGQGGRDGFDSGRGGRDGFDGSRGGRGNFDGSRGGRGGFDGSRGGRGGFDGGRGGRGGFDGSRGRGSFDGGRGGRGGFESGRGGRGSFNGGRSGNDEDRGGYDGGRGGFGGGRGSRGRGSFSNSRDSFDSGRGERSGFGSNRGSFENEPESRGGFDRKRSYDDGPGSNSGGYSSYDSNSYADNSFNTQGSFGRDSRGRGPSSQGNYGGRDYGSDSNPDLGGSRNQSSSHGGSAGGRDNSNSTFDYGRNSSGQYNSGYSSYGDYNDKSGTYPATTYKKELDQSTESSSLDNSSRGTRAAVRPSGRTSTRWGAETTKSQTTYTQATTVSTADSQQSYSSYGTSVKTETVASAAQPQYDAYSTYAQSNTALQGYAAAPAYGYQQPLTTTMAPQQWPTAQPPPPPPPANPPVPATAEQANWAQYYQQAQTTSQYYSQYFGQAAAAAAAATTLFTPAYGTK